MNIYIYYTTLLYRYTIYYTIYTYDTYIYIYYTHVCVPGQPLLEITQTLDPKKNLTYDMFVC